MHATVTGTPPRPLRKVPALGVAAPEGASPGHGVPLDHCVLFGQISPCSFKPNITIGEGTLPSRKPERALCSCGYDARISNTALFFFFLRSS